MPTKVYFQKSSFNSKKARVALALALSLWIGEAGIASAYSLLYINADNGDKVMEVGGNMNCRPTPDVGQTATEKKLTVTDGNCNNWRIYGGISAGDISGYTLILDGTGDVECAYGGYSESGNAAGNILELKDSFIINDVCGGWVNVGTGNATGNKVTVTNSSVSDNGIVLGGCSGNGDVTGNRVEFTSGTINGKVYGGYSISGTVDNNIVTISGGTFGANTEIHGGYGGSAATNNTVNILKQITVGGLIGGSTVVVSNSTGNTLNLAAKGVTTGVLDRFQNLNFYIPTDMSKTDTMLTVSGTANVADAKVGVMAQGKLVNLVKNDKVTLLHANTLNGTVSQTTEINVPESIATIDTYKFDVTSDTNNIYATITEEPSDEGGGNGSQKNEAMENTKSIVETKAATTTFINAGADMLASQGFQQAANAVALETAAQSKGGEAAEQSKSGGAGAPTVSSFTPFAAFGGSSMRAESGSYVDTKGFGLNVGFAREISNANGKLLFGPVVEYGGGSYDSYLDNGIHGEGGSHYFGVGIMARQINRDGFYYEGSLRGGRVTSDYKSTFNLQDINYDTASNYWAAHLGLGKVYDLGKGNTLDGYLKYFYSHQSGDDVTMHASITGDEQWSFDAVNSHRIRIGARLTHKVNEKNSYYGGVAYQYEFGGDATAHYNGGSTPSPSVKGSSGMLELGWQVKPGNGPLTLDLGLNGWVGKQRGGSVQMGATWSF